MQTLWKISLSIGLIGLSASSAIAVNPTSPGTSFGRRSIRIAQTSSPYQQLLQTRSCVDCNLSNLDLQGLDLSGVNLQNANLSNTNLSNSNLRQANLTGANLYLSNLSGSDLSQANFSNASAKSANFAAATLRQSLFSETVATYANFSNADFSDASIDGSNFSDTNLTAANFANASINNTAFNFGTLDQADFGTSRVVDSSFSSTSTVGTILPSSTAIALDDRNQTSPSVGSTTETMVEANQPRSIEEPQNTTDSEESIPENFGENTANETEIDRPAVNFAAQDSPLASVPFQRPTADHLRAGEFVLQGNARTFFTEDFNQAATEGTPFWPSAGIRIGITSSTELGLAFQNFDPVSIQRQGAFNPLLDDDSPTWDFAVELKQRVWKNSSDTQALSIAASIAGFTEPKFIFRNPPTTLRAEGNELVPAFSAPFTAKVNPKLNLTIAPTLALFPSDSALFLHVLPQPDSGSFGTNLGLTGAVSYQVHPRLTVWADGFFPFVGNNSINSNSGRPTKTPAVNAGLRYLLNPRVGVDIFATNTFGTFGPQSLTAERDNIGLGVGLVTLPSLGANRSNYPNSFEGQSRKKDSPLTTDGLGFFDGGTVPERRVLAQVQGGSHGVMSALRVGVARDLEFAAYLDYVLGNIDESEQGLNAKLRFLNQDDGAPFTLSASLSLGVGNELVNNIRNNDAQSFVNSNQNKSVPFLFGGRLSEGEALYIGTASLPMQYRISNKAAVWATPAIGFVQRSGLTFAGINVGGSVGVLKDVSLLAELGATFGGDGNTFVNNRLVDRIPWNLGVRWQPTNFLGVDYSSALMQPSFEVFVTNRVGGSTFHQFRVLEGNDLAVGAGVSFPF